MPHIPHCLCCQLWPVHPEAVAGLCQACCYEVQHGIIGISTHHLGSAVDPRGLSLYEKFPIPTDPPGEPQESWYIAFNPGRLFAEPQPESVYARIREELLSLIPTRPRNKLKQARELVDAIRLSGVSIQYEHCCVILDRPKLLSYELLASFCELQTYIVDVLTHEETEAIRREEDDRRREAYRDFERNARLRAMATEHPKVDSTQPEQGTGETLVNRG